jgi:nucleotide-binding universal stress UspA family protein
MKRFKQILCVVASVKQDQLALERAVSLAENNHAKLTVATVTPLVTADIEIIDGGPVSTDLQESVVNAKQQELENLVQPYRERLAIQTKVLVGIAFLEIIREVLRQGHDLVIKIPDAADWLDRLFGSDDMHLLRKCPCPVWLIKSETAKPYRRILAAVDVNDEYPPEQHAARTALNRQILEMAISLALSEFAELHIVHAWEAMGESTMRGAFLHTPEDKINAYVEQVRQQQAARFDSLIQEVTSSMGQDAVNYLNPQTHLVKGQARKEIPVLAKQISCDLVVMGTVARTGIPGFIMGNTAETILNQIDCSVMAIKPPSFQTPVTIE